MPIYEYDCRKCGPFEVTQSLSEDPLSRCPECRSKVTKLISSSSFHLKGGGWYSDGYSAKSDSDQADPSKADSNKASEKTDASSKTDSKKETKTKSDGTKPAAKASSKSSKAKAASS